MIILTFTCVTEENLEGKKRDVNTLNDLSHWKWRAAHSRGIGWASDEMFLATDNPPPPKKIGQRRNKNVNRKQWKYRSDRAILLTCVFFLPPENSILVIEILKKKNNLKHEDGFSISISTHLDFGKFVGAISLFLIGLHRKNNYQLTSSWTGGYDFWFQTKSHSIIFLYARFGIITYTFVYYYWTSL